MESTKTALAIFRYFPHGGLQRDMRRIAEELLVRGHQLTIYTTAWQGEALPEAQIVTVPVRGWSNHARMRDFGRQVAKLARGCDVLVGFNRLPGLDVYFAADNCFGLQAAQKPWWVKLFTRRYAIYGALERAVCAPEKGPEILHITPRQKQEFQHLYGTPESRFHLLPPGIAPDRKRPGEAEAAAIRQAKRAEWGIAPDEVLFLSIGSGFRTKGVDRTLKALATLNGKWRWLVAGYDGRLKQYREQARRLDPAGRIVFAGGSEDIPALLLAADLLVHPARNEAAGTVLTEALAAGLPVCASSVCGFANHVRDSGGAVLPEPFEVEELRRELEYFTADPSYREQLTLEARRYGAQADFYQRAAVAAELIEMVAAKKAQEEL